MFGHTDDQQITDNNFVQSHPGDTTYSNSQATATDGTVADDTSQQTATSTPLVNEPTEPVTPTSPFSQPDPSSPIEPISNTDSSALATANKTDDNGDDNSADSTTDHTELLDIKQQALQQLSPLVSHLDQTPEDKFKTTMMMIQASDDHALLPEAYKAAQAITDEKTRAQALLDVVNEINYFTQS